MVVRSDASVTERLSAASLAGAAALHLALFVMDRALNHTAFLVVAAWFVALMVQGAALVLTRGESRVARWGLVVATIVLIGLAR